MMTAILILTALAFAWSMGAHYTGACMGMPYATGSIKLRPALGLMAVMTLIGATLFSHRVLAHVGEGIVFGRLPMIAAIIVLVTAFLLTTVFTRLRIPTSTIQILVFALLGAAVPFGLGIRWRAISQLVALWVFAPFIAFGLGFVFTKLLDRIPGLSAHGVTWGISFALVSAGALASLTMGANDVSNATAVFLSVHFSGPWFAGLVGGTGLALGVVSWGRPLLERVAFDVVKMDRIMATAAQLVQGLVVLTAVGFGYFTSMNQALIGAMAGAGLARDRRTIETKVMIAILRGWVIGPAVGFLVAYGISQGYRLVIGG